VKRIDALLEQLRNVEKMPKAGALVAMTKI
jgi:hypothetical protein